MSTSARNMLDSISGYVNSTSGGGSSADRPVRLATIDPYYTVGNPRVIFDGEGSLSEKTYAFASDYSPTAGDRVYMLPVGNSFIVVNKIAPTPTRPVFLPMSLIQGLSKPYSETAYSPIRITKTLSGAVLISGMVEATVGKALAVIPEPLRPEMDMDMPAISSSGKASLSISAETGEIMLIAPLATGTVLQWVSLDQITYPTNPDLAWQSIAPKLVNGWTAEMESGNDLDLGYAKDRNGRVWFRGRISRSPNPAAESLIFNMPEGYRPEFQQHFINDGYSYFSGNDVGSNGDYRWKDYSGSALSLKLDHTSYFDKSVGGWTDLAYINNWKRVGTGFPNIGYKKDPDGVVHLRGLITGGSLNTTAATLPAGVRPKYRLLRTTVAGGFTTPARFDILPDGRIEIVSGGNLGWFSLDGQSFVAEQ